MLLIALGGVVLGFAFLLISLLTDNAAWAWACIAICVLAAVVLVADILRRRARRAAPVSAGSTGGEVPVAATDPSAAAGTTLEAPPVIAPASAAAEPGPADPVDPASEHGPTAANGDVVDPTYSVDTAAVTQRAPRGDEPTEVITGRRAAGSYRWDPETVDAPTQQIAAVRDPDNDISPADLIKSVPPPRGPVPDSATEPDEESVARGAGESVAFATAEVVVVDERPRYHLRDCAWLGGRAVIPLPVGEAIELGFSPCGVCRPVAALTAVAGGQSR